MEKLRDQIEKYLKNPESGFLGEPNLLALLFRCAEERQPLENEAIREAFAKLENELHHLPLKDNNRVFFIVTELCDQYARQAFSAGFEVGLRFREEVSPLLRTD